MNGNQWLWKKLNDLVIQWQDGLPSHQALISLADELERWKAQHGIFSLWKSPARMVTATIDDGIGQGIAVINQYARLTGLDVTYLGLLQSPETIVGACRQIQPNWLGVTVLQLDSEDDLCAITSQLPRVTQVLAGGPALVIDPEIALRTGIHYTARNLALFLKIMLADSKIHSYQGDEKMSAPL